jgi:hypothetical protein
MTRLVEHPVSDRSNTRLSLRDVECYLATGPGAAPFHEARSTMSCLCFAGRLLLGHQEWDGPGSCDRPRNVTEE